MRVICPSCRATMSLDVAMEDQAARELMALLAELQAEVARPLLSYLGLFRSRQRALGWDRALRLAREVLELGPVSMLVPALLHTIDSMRGKQAQPTWKPLTTHNYLKRVMETVESRAVAVVEEEQGEADESRTLGALRELEGLKRRG